MLLLLLDADVIIDLHRLGIWKHIIKNHNIYIPSIILRREIYHYEDEKGRQYPIDLAKEVGITIDELSCSAEELLSFKEHGLTVGDIGAVVHSENEVLNAVMEWKQRRKPSFNRSEVAITIHNLASSGLLTVKPIKELPVQEEIFV